MTSELLDRIVASLATVGGIYDFVTACVEADNRSCCVDSPHG